MTGGFVCCDVWLGIRRHPTGLNVIGTSRRVRKRGLQFPAQLSTFAYDFSIKVTHIPRAPQPQGRLMKARRSPQLLKRATVGGWQASARGYLPSPGGSGNSGRSERRGFRMRRSTFTIVRVIVGPSGDSLFSIRN